MREPFRKPGERFQISEIVLGETQGVRMLKKGL